MNKLFIIFLSVFLLSCGSEEIVKVEMEIQYFNEIDINTDEKEIEKLGLIPELYEISKPFKINDAHYVFRPLSIKRVDLSRKIEIDYLNKKGRNYEKINAIIRAHREYFKDGKDVELDKDLSIPVQQKLDFDSYVNENKDKANYFFIDFNGNLKINGEEVPSSEEQLVKKIEKFILSSNKEKEQKPEFTKIVVVVTPNYYKAPIEIEPIDTTANITEVIPVEPSAPEGKTTPIVKPDPKPLTKQETAGSLDEYFKKLGNSSIPYEAKVNLRKGVLNYFKPGATVIFVTTNMNKTGVDDMTVSEFAEHLCSTFNHVKIMKQDPSEGKISKIYVSEYK